MLTPFLCGRELSNRELTGQINATALTSLHFLEEMWVSYDMWWWSFESVCWPQLIDNNPITLITVICPTINFMVASLTSPWGTCLHSTICKWSSTMVIYYYCSLFCCSDLSKNILYFKYTTIFKIKLRFSM